MRGDAPALDSIVNDDDICVDAYNVFDIMLLAEAEGLAIISFIFADCCYIGAVVTDL